VAEVEGMKIEINLNTNAVGAIAIVAIVALGIAFLYFLVSI